MPAEQVVRDLRARGLDAEIVGSPPDPVIAYTRGVQLVQIMIPEQQYDAALRALSTIDSTRARRVEAMHARIRAHLLTAALVAAAAACFVVIADRGLSESVFSYALAAAIVSLVVTGLLESWRRRRRAAELGPLCDGCDYPLVGLTEPRCPECGLPTDPPRSPLGP
jgi:hypothetical protein